VSGLWTYADFFFFFFFLCSNTQQRAIASRPETAVKGYILGGSAWLAIPLGFASCMGLAAAVLRGDPAFPGLTKEQVSAGLPAAAAAQTLLGSSGAVILLM